jgi:8-oxo-dGTP diphosphatase
MTEYVAGFMFDDDKVALVVKNRPKWQSGRMNGIGGHIESGETEHEAMAREFQEETGYVTDPDQWYNFNTLSGKDWKVYFFYGFGKLSQLKSTTDEEIVIVPVSEVDVYNSIPNLTWLIPMAKSIDFERAARFVTEEQ